jgi:hypothetical protein
MEIKYRLHLNKLLPPNPVTVELGVAEGNFSRDIMVNWNPSYHYLVDNWGTLPYRGDGGYDQEWHNKNYASMLEKMKPYTEKIRILRGVSWYMAQHVKDSSLDIVYMDASHEYEPVKREVEAWLPKLKPGGVIASHDAINPAYGVMQAFNELGAQLGSKLNIIPEDKEEDAGCWMYKPK